MNWLAELFANGGPTMIAIACVAVGGLIIFIERTLAFRSLMPDVRDIMQRVREASIKGDAADVLASCAGAQHWLAQVLSRGIHLAMHDASEADVFNGMAREARRLTLKLRRGVGLLATLGTMAPFLGLLGTVLGIMRALKNMGASGEGGYGVVATGVAEALVTTAAGIIVAVVIVLLHQALKSMLGQAVLEVQLLVEEAAEHLTRTRDGAKARRDREGAADGG